MTSQTDLARDGDGDRLNEMSDAAQRIERLAARVRWCDRHRRAIAITLAFMISPAVMFKLEAILGGSWRMGAVLFPMVMLGFVVWWAIEALFALQMALWETEHDRLSRDLGLPTARLVTRRRR